MASLKGSRGLTHGRSLTESSRLDWILFRPGVLSIDSKIKEMTDVNLKSSEQNLKFKHVIPSTLSRNAHDKNLMETFFKARYLLDIDAMSNTDRKLRNIANGLVAPSTASVTNIKECGDKILVEMAGCTPLTYKFQRSMQTEQIPAKMDSQSSKSKSVDIVLDLLFQRILSVCSDEEQMSEAISHDLAHYPPSLFIEGGFLRTGEKSALCKLILEENPFCDVMPNITS